MDSFIFSLNATMPVFLVIVLGYILKQIGLFTDEFCRVGNKYAFLVALPVLLFRDIAQTNLYEDFELSFVLYCAGVTTLVFLGVWFLAAHILKDKSLVGAFAQASVRSSAAILGIAFVENMYGNAGLAPLMIVSAVPLFNIYSVIILTFSANGGQHGTEAIRKACINVLKNPIIIGIVLGFLASVAGLKQPVIMQKTIQSVAQTATPVALICIGAGFEGSKAIKKIKPTLTATFIKLVGIAAIAIPVAVMMGFRNQELVAILIMTASPSTVTCYIMAKNMDNDGVLSSSIIVLTTLLSSITLTGWIFVLRSLGLI